MLEPNDIAFRLLCKKAGCGLTYTGMINPLSKKKLDLQDKPGLQLFCNSTAGLKEFMKKYDKKVSLWDFNLGCPSDLSRKFKHGVFMHKDLEGIEKILKVIRENTKKPVTIKLRKSAHALEIARLAENYVDALTIHPRTEKQGYSGKPDVDFALKLKEEVSVPVIYSGDVNEGNADNLLEKFDFVMVGRAAIGNPGIFSELKGKKRKMVGFLDYLKLAEKYKLPWKIVKMQAMNFTKSMKNAKELRRKLVYVKNVEEVRQIFNN